MKYFIIFISFIFLKASFLILPYSGFITYSNSSKKTAGVYGGYVNYFKFPYKYEIDLEHLRINFRKNTYIKDYIQNDITFLLNRYYGYHYAFKAGIHNIFIKQKYNKDTYDRFFILGAMYYVYMKYYFGMDLYRSSYDKSLQIYQFTPYFGLNFGNFYSKIGSFFINTKFNFIKLNTDKVSGRSFYKNVD